jgi:hypothetical protein
VRRSPARRPSRLPPDATRRRRRRAARPRRQGAPRCPHQHNEVRMSHISILELRRRCAVPAHRASGRSAAPSTVRVAKSYRQRVGLRVHPVRPWPVAQELALPQRHQPHRPPEEQECCGDRRNGRTRECIGAPTEHDDGWGVAIGDVTDRTRARLGRAAARLRRRPALCPGLRTPIIARPITRDAHVPRSRLPARLAQAFRS